MQNKWIEFLILNKQTGTYAFTQHTCVLFINKYKKIYLLAMKTKETVVKYFLNNTFNITAYYVTFKLS